MPKKKQSGGLGGLFSFKGDIDVDDGYGYDPRVEFGKVVAKPVKSLLEKLFGGKKINRKRTIKL